MFEERRPTRAHRGEKICDGGVKRGRRRLDGEARRRRTDFQVFALNRGWAKRGWQKPNRFRRVCTVCFPWLQGWPLLAESAVALKCDVRESWRRAKEDASVRIQLRRRRHCRMWMDRLGAYSGASGPSPAQNRTYSPISRPPSHLAVNRPTFSPRSSSLSLASTPNASNTSLPGSLRQATGPPPRLDTRRPTETTVRDPLEVLESIIGKRVSRNGTVENQGDKAVEKPDAFVESIDFDEASLEQFVSNGDSDECTRQAPLEPMPIEQCELHSVHIEPRHLRTNFVNISSQLRRNKIDFRNSIHPLLCVRPSCLRR